MKAVTVDDTRLARLLDPSIHLRAGTGIGANGTIDCCAVQASNWIAGGKGDKDDHPSIDRVIRAFTVRLNDAGTFAEYRDELKPFAARILGTERGVKLRNKRMFMCADWSVRVIAPMAMDFAGLTEQAAKLRAYAPIVDKATAEAGRLVAASAARAESAASAASAAWAESAARAASAAWDAWAACDKRAIWDEALAFLGRLIEAS